MKPLLGVALALAMIGPAHAAVYYCGVAPIDGAPLGDTWRVEVTGDAARVSDVRGMDQQVKLDGPTTAGGMSLRDFTVQASGKPLAMVLIAGKRTVSLARKGGETLMCFGG